HDLDQPGGEVRGEHRGEPNPAEPGNLDEHSQQGGKARAGNEVRAVMTQVHGGEHDFGVPGADEKTGLVVNYLRLEAPAGAPRERYHAERAPVLAAVLDLQERARATVQPGDRRHLDRPGSRDVGDVRLARDNAVEEIGKTILVPVADDQVDLAHGGDIARARLSPASGDDQLRAGAHAGRAADHLAVGE